MMNNGNGEDRFDKSAFTQVSSLSIDEMQIYAEADSVKSFYYTSTISLNGTDEFEAISTTSSSSESSIDSMMGKAGMEMPGMDSGKGGGFQKGGMGVQGDFTIIGYSSDEAMTDFVAGTTLIDGKNV